MQNTPTLAAHAVSHIRPDGANYVVAAGATTVNSDAIDCAGLWSIALLLTLGAMVATATVDVKVQGSSDGVSGWTDLAGTAAPQAVAATDSNKLIGIEIVRPAYRYIRLVIARATANTTLEGLIALKRVTRKMPATQATTAGQFVAAPEMWVSPIAGTA